MRRLLFYFLILIFMLAFLPGCQALVESKPTDQPTLNPPTAQPTAAYTPTITPTPMPTTTPTEIPCRETQGTIIDVEIPTGYLNRPVNTKIYLPPVMTGNLILAIRRCICCTGRQRAMTSGCGWV